MSRRPRAAQPRRPLVGVADDAAFHVRPARLELRLHEHERLPARLGEPEHGRERLAHADERDVAGHEVRRERELLQVPRVHAFHHRHTRILSHPLVQLRAAHVERDHAPRAVLEQDVREAARGRADVDGVAAGRIHAQLLQRVGELLPPRDTNRGGSSTSSGPPRPPAGPPCRNRAPGRPSRAPAPVCGTRRGRAPRGERRAACASVRRLEG